MVISKTPLRVSLLGGNTDFKQYFQKHGGAVLTTTIDKYIYCIVSKRFDKEIRINYSVKEIVTSVEKIKHNLVREAMRLTGVTQGVEITFLSDIPSEGSGLGSSSALTVGLLNALHAFKNDVVMNKQLAEEACFIEIDLLKHPIGYQDQYAVAVGGFNLIEFNKDTINIIPLKPDRLEESLFLFYTGISRQSNKILSTMKLDITILNKIKKEVYQKLDHITDPLILGDLLDRYWAFKQQLNPQVTNKKINKMYKTLLEYGAMGGKIVGAGGGGFLLVAAHPEDTKNVRSTNYQELKFRFTPYGTRIIFCDE